MEKIYILGFGCGDKGEVTLRTLDILKKCDAVYVRTMRHPAAEILMEYNIEHTAFDDRYETADSFDALYESIAETVVNGPGNNVAYIVPGSAVFAEKTVLLIREKAACPVVIIPAVSFTDGLFAALGKDAADSFKLIDALRIKTQPPDATTTNIICQVYDNDIASDLKLSLMKYYDDNQDIIIITGASTSEERILKTKLFELDRTDAVNHLTTVVIPPADKKGRYGFTDFTDIIRKLRSEHGCPWDRAQTHESLTPYIIEEAYEMIDAIKNNDTDNLCEELGDVLLQIMLHAAIAEESGAFDIGDVIDNVSKKMIRRHPHVFTDMRQPDDINRMWENIKFDEHRYASQADMLSGVARSLPALLYAQKIQKKAGEIGFDFKSAKEASLKIDEELSEMFEAYETGSKENLTEEAGDLLFAAVNTVRLMNISAEDALKISAEKFIKRFREMEQMCVSRNEDITCIGIDKLNAYWEQTKSADS